MYDHFLINHSRWHNASILAPTGKDSQLMADATAPPSRQRHGSSAWRARSACRGLDSALFFPGQGESVSEAQAVCAGCAVRTECTTYALESGQRFGIWGGTTERARRRLRAERRAVAEDGEVAA